MDLSLFQHRYQQLKSQLQQLRTDLPSLGEQKGQAPQRGQALLQFWQQQFATESGEILPETAYPSWRSLQTELHRELRLINVDLMFLENSHVAVTKDQKRREIGDRLTRLEQYCTQILSLIDGDKPAT